MADETVTSILRAAGQFQRGEEANPDRNLHLVLLNRCLDEISSAVGGFNTYWNNDSTDATYGTLSLSSADVTFPSDVVDIDSKGVYWDGSQLGVTTVARLDASSGTWRTDTDTPTQYARTQRGIVLNVIPSGTTDAMLDIYGRGSIPHIATDRSSIAYIPYYRQLAMVDYVIAGLPIDYRNKTDVQIATMHATRGRAEKRWAEQFKQLVGDLRRRSSLPLGTHVETA
jgi:hypothetical protein